MTYQFKIELTNISNPKVWRRITVPGNFTFFQFHEEIQEAFGWDNSHLFEFISKQNSKLLRIGVLDPEFGEGVVDVEEMLLSEVFTDTKIKCTYIYDFGDNWEHNLILEKIIKTDSEEAQYIDGVGACPPEDCGGPFGYEELKRVLANKSHPEYQEILDWLGLEDGSDWNPNEVGSLKEIRMKLNYEDIMQSFDDLSTVEVIPEKVLISTEIPKFNHPEVTIFYETGAEIDRGKLYQIMNLTRTTLIQDMEKMLIDSIARYEYFSEKEEDDKTQSFPRHALYVLSSLKAEESLNTLFTFLRQTEEYYEYWFGDILSNEFLSVIYHVGGNQLPILKDFIMESNRYTYTRTAIFDTVLQIGLHQPERKQEVIDWMESVLKNLRDNRENKNLFDDTVFSSLICDLFDIGDETQLALIKQYYAENLVAEYYVGPFNELKKDFAKRKGQIEQKTEIFTTIDQFYDDWLHWVNLSKERLNFTPKDSYSFKEPIPYIAEPKVGRNDPCLCGSGKKYKKCCGAN